MNNNKKMLSKKCFDIPYLQAGNWIKQSALYVQPQRIAGANPCWLIEVKISNILNVCWWSIVEQLFGELGNALLQRHHLHPVPVCTGAGCSGLCHLFLIRQHHPYDEKSKYSPITYLFFLNLVKSRLILHFIYLDSNILLQRNFYKTPR